MNWVFTAVSRHIHLVATLERFRRYAVATDGSGNVYTASDLVVYKWTAATRQITTVVSGLHSANGVAVDQSGNIYIGDTYHNAVKKAIFAFVGPEAKTVSAAAGTDSLLPVLPATAPLNGTFAPTSDQSWLTIGTISGGTISFSYTANMGTAAGLPTSRCLDSPSRSRKMDKVRLLLPRPEQVRRTALRSRSR